MPNPNVGKPVLIVLIVLATWLGLPVRYNVPVLREISCRMHGMEYVQVFGEGGCI